MEFMVERGNYLFGIYDALTYMILRRRKPGRNGFCSSYERKPNDSSVPKCKSTIVASNLPECSPSHSLYFKK